MVSELFFCFLHHKVRTDFERILLTHTVTHITIGHSGQGSTKGIASVTMFSKIEKFLGIAL